MDLLHVDNLNHALDMVADQYGSKIFLSYEDKNLTFAQFREYVLRFANVLLSCGVKKGDYVGIHAPNSLEFVISVFSCFRIGAVATPLIIQWKTREITETIHKAQIKLMICQNSPSNIITRCDKLELIQTVINVGEIIETSPKIKGEFWQLLHAALATDPSIKITEQNLATCHFTDGTTGKSKGVLHTHRNLLYATHVIMQTIEITDADATILILPMTHVFGFCQLLISVFGGVKVTLLDRFNPQQVLKVLTDPDITLFCGVPTIYTMLLAQHNLDEFHFSKKLRLFISGANALSSETATLIQSRFLSKSGIITQAYGSTEDLCCGTNTYPKSTPGSIGTPLQGVSLEIIDSTGSILPMGKENIGIIAIQHEAVMMGYLGNPKAHDPVDYQLTRTVLKPIRGKSGNWYWTGDLGYRDLDGSIYLTDRLKDIAKISGRLVFPEEIESVMGQNPLVDQIAVISVPHEIYGEQLLAVIVPKEKHENTTILEEELKKYAEENLAKYKIPRIWWIRPTLKRNEMGAVLKRWYREEYLRFGKREDLHIWLSPEFLP